MNCVNCEHENPDKALICYWCGLDPTTGEPPYQALAYPVAGPVEALSIPEVTLPAPIQIAPPMPVPDIQIDLAAPDSLDLAIPELPPIEIAPPPSVPDREQFRIVRRRARHRPTIRASHAPRVETRPVLPGLSRLLVLVGGLVLLFALGSALIAAVGAASLGNVFVLVMLLGLLATLWVGLLLVRAGKRVAKWTDVAYERLEVLGRVLREVAPGVVQELPVNLPRKMGVLDLPVAFSELHSLSRRKDGAPTELAVDLLTGAIANLVGRDAVVLAHRTFPVETRGALTRPRSTQVNQPILTRRRVYVGPGALEERIAQTLRTDRPMSVEELLHTLIGPAGGQKAQQIVAWVDRALVENPPDLDALASPDEALAELMRFREAMREADPELYKLLENEIRRGLGARIQRSIPSSLLDLARYTSTANGQPSQQQRKSDSQRKG